MSYVIIRNVKYKKDNLKGIFRHNERRNTNYSNNNIDKEKSYLNYSLKDCKFSYEKEFEEIRKEYSLKGQVKVVSNIACEYIITSDKDFFEAIGEGESKRFFKTAYQFVCDYKNLGEQYILSAKVHMDEETPHMHLVFIPVVHTTDKKGNSIDKIACSEFWKERDSYRQLQNAFYNYMVEHQFDLQRGLPKEETNREHIDLKNFKEITNFAETKSLLDNIKLELPNVPELKDIKKVMIGRDEKILNEIIKPKNDLINELYKENVTLHKELYKQSNIIDIAEKYQNEKNSILEDNEKLNIKVQHLENEYKKKNEILDLKFSNRKDTLEKEFKNKTFDIEYTYKNKIHKLEKENNHLHKIIDKFEITIHKFIVWICNKFSVSSEDEIIRDFEKENNLCIEPEKQIENEEKENEEMEL